MPEQSSATRAVFLSYASQDAEAAARICEFLRAAGIEVWFDQSELRGGDAWDSKIKKQIHDCALFIPVISEHTNARAEGYFRREWKLAARRLLDIADDAAFLVPVLVDGTREPNARVPEEFFGVQWTRLPAGETPPAFAQHVRQLLGVGTATQYTANSTVSAANPTSAPQAVSAQPWLRFAGFRGKYRAIPVGLRFIALLILGAGAFWYYQRASDEDLATERYAGSKLTAADPEATTLRLAVLPLENLSPDPANAFFADGLHDEILSAMSATPDLQVVSRTTMRTYAGTTKTVKQIATELGASHLLEGAVRRAGDQVRLTLQLIDAGSDSNIWSQTFDRSLSNALSLQSEVASKVATALDVRLRGSGDVTKLRSATGTVGTDPVAYDLYLKGKVQLDVKFSELQNTRDYDQLEALVAHAIEIDPRFANAYALRARVLLTRLWDLRDLSKQQWQTIRNDIDLARGLDDESAAVLAAEATLEYYGLMDYQRALKTTRAARARFPNDLDLRELEGLLLRRLGHWDEAIAVFRELVNREGANPNYVITLGESLLSARQYRQVVTIVHAFEQRTAPDNQVAALAALATEAIEHDPELLRKYVDTWRDRLDPAVSWGYEESYLRDTGRTEELASHLVATEREPRGSMGRFVDSGFLTPPAIMNGYGRMLRGARTAPEQAREVLAAADRINWLPSREWNVALLEAQAALMSGERRRAIAQARHALELMTVERDALLGTTNMVAAATVLAWAGEATEAVPILRRVIEVPSLHTGWALVRDPLLAVPLAGHPAFEALKREWDPPKVGGHIPGA